MEGELGWGAVRWRGSVARRLAPSLESWGHIRVSRWADVFDRLFAGCQRDVGGLARDDLSWIKPESAGML